MGFRPRWRARVDKHQQLAQKLGPEEQFGSAALVLLMEYVKTDDAEERFNLERELMCLVGQRIMDRNPEIGSLVLEASELTAYEAD
jgi:hypothetical protein